MVVGEGGWSGKRVSACTASSMSIAGAASVASRWNGPTHLRMTCPGWSARPFGFRGGRGPGADETGPTSGSGGGIGHNRHPRFSAHRDSREGLVAPKVPTSGVSIPQLLFTILAIVALR